METAQSSESLDLHTIRSRINELEDIYRNCADDASSVTPSPDSNQLLSDCVEQLQSKVNQLLSESADFNFLGIEDTDAYLAHLEEELSAAQAESAKVSNEIEVLTRTHMEDSIQLQSNLESLKCSLDFVSSQDSGREKDSEMECVSPMEDESNLTNEYRDHEFEILKLDTQIENSKMILKSMQDLDSVFKRFDAIEQIEDEFSGLKVLEFDGTCIRLSLRTFIPKFEDLLYIQKTEDTAEVSEVNHELLIEIDNGTMELKNVEMIPNDVYIGDIIESAKSFRKLYSQSAFRTRPSLEWFVRKAQDRIVQCTLRRMVVKNANKSRLSLEYLDRDETIIAHMTQGIDAFIKVSPGWPMTSSPLKLISLESQDHRSKELSLSLLHRVEEMANSLDVHSQQNLSSYVDAIEKALVDQMQL